jgi:alpha-D-ribose 1-methylphosphonate 5-triphosphate synthase subunit PhnH
LIGAVLSGAFLSGASTNLTKPGFADPVRDSQACFRAVLDAMARPGQIVTVAAAMDPPPMLDTATAAVLLTLADTDTPLWLDAAASPARDWIAFHCGAPAATAGSATLALALGPVRLDAFPAGTDDAPEQGATLILQLTALGHGAVLELSGPGLAAPSTLAADGLPNGFVAEWAANRALFPRGVDIILCAGNQLAALPRTVRIREA